MVAICCIPDGGIISENQKINQHKIRKTENNLWGPMMLRMRPVESGAATIGG
jgi:hypothetical protein